MKSWVRRTTVLAAGLTMVGGAVATSATAAQVLAWECPSGFVCFYDNPNGTVRLWVAPGPG